jgi:hypothetical protein
MELGKLWALGADRCLQHLRNADDNTGFSPQLPAQVEGESCWDEN